MIWHKFNTTPPPEDGKPKLIVWYRGAERIKELAVAWRSVNDLKESQNMGEQDELGYWTELTDPEEQD